MSDTPQTEGSLTATARAIPFDRRAAILTGMKETMLHGYLKRLLERMVPGALVEVTHGTEEKGKDLVLVRDDGLDEHVSAFVVKVGKLTGASGGIVDVVKSQIEQAIAHPAKLRSAVVPKRVNQVYVTIFGPVSKGARERLEEEFKTALSSIWDIQRLVNEFTKHYPEVFYAAEVGHVPSSGVNRWHHPRSESRVLHGDG